MVKARAGLLYASVDDVNRALDIANTARADDQVARALGSASDMVEGLLGRRFYPETRTVAFSWPQPFGSDRLPATLLLGRQELISVGSVVSGGETITDYFLEPQDGPPYTRIELDASTSAAFERGNANQRSVTVTGLFGYSNDTQPVGTVDGALNAVVTTVDLDSGQGLVGVGDLILVDDEYMVVTGKAFTAWDAPVTLAAALTSASGPYVDVSAGGGALFSAGDVVLVDAERMLVIDVNTDRLSVKRAYDGSTLAAHALAAPVLCLRRLTVVRGALGSTAATHDDGAVASKHVVPPLVKALTIAEAMATLLQERTGYARIIGSGEHQSEVRGVGLADLRDQALRAYGRKPRSRAS